MRLFFFLVFFPRSLIYFSVSSYNLSSITPPFMLLLFSQRTSRFTTKTLSEFITRWQMEGYLVHKPTDETLRENKPWTGMQQDDLPDNAPHPPVPCFSCVEICLWFYWYDTCVSAPSASRFHAAWDSRWNRLNVTTDDETLYNRSERTGLLSLDTRCHIPFSRSSLSLNITTRLSCNLEQQLFVTFAAECKAWERLIFSQTPPTPMATTFHAMHFANLTPFWARCRSSIVCVSVCVYVFSFLPKRDITEEWITPL